MKIERKKIPSGLIGMVHLKALPGSPEYAGDLDAIEAAALADARNLVAGGVNAILIENFGDVPFSKNIGVVTVGAMTRIVRAIVEASDVPVGVNALRNDATAALSIAETCGATFIRVNVHIGAMVTDQGLIEGTAAETLRLRNSLSSKVAILADVGVKHATPFDVNWTIEQEAKDAWHRGLADALIVSGSGTGLPTSLEDFKRVHFAVPDAPIILGSGVNESTSNDLLGLASAWIVGTALKHDGDVNAAVDLNRVKAISKL